MTVFFGERWNAPIVDGAEQVPTPVGVPCYACERPIEPDDQGLIRPVIDDGETATTLPVHRGCEMAQIIGHVFSVCSCTGWDDVYEAGRELVRRVEELHANDPTPQEPEATA